MLSKYVDFDLQAGRQHRLAVYLMPCELTRPTTGQHPIAALTRYELILHRNCLNSFNNYRKDQIKMMSKHRSLTRNRLCLLNMALFILYYLFTFRLGIDRANIFVKYAYIYGALLSAAVCFVSIKNRIRYSFNKEVLIVFCLMQGLTIFLGVFNGGDLKLFINVGHQVMFAIIFAGIYRIYGFNQETFAIFFSDLIIFICTFSLVFALFGYLHGSFAYGPFIYDSHQRYDFRLDGWYSSANCLGPALSVGAVVILNKIINRELFQLTTISKCILILLFICHICGILLTGSKGSYGAFAIGVFTLLLLQKKLFCLSLKHILLLVIGTAIVAISSIKIMSSLGYDKYRVEKELIRIETIDQNMRGGDRVGYHQTAFRMIKNASLRELLVGYGMSHFLEETGHATHSGYIDIVVGRGVLVFSLFIVLIVHVYGLSFKIRHFYNIGTLTLSVMNIIVVKNFTNTEIPSNTFTGITFIFVLVLIASIPCPPLPHRPRRSGQSAGV